MSEMTIEVSPLAKWGLSRPPLTAIPNPYPGTFNNKYHYYYSNKVDIITTKVIQLE